MAKPRAVDTVKETLESILMALILAFVFRAFVVEAFVIPTGSMAPTLLGEHLTIESTPGGYPFKAGIDSYSGLRAMGQGRFAPFLTSNVQAVDPMTQALSPLPRGQRISPGDRILVLKSMFHFNEPRRWDVVVFKNPQIPGQNYIKRLVALPGEALRIIEGNLYIQRPDGPWRIARKTDRSENPHAIDIQRRVWQPMTDTRYTRLASTSWTDTPWEPVTQQPHWQPLGQRGFAYTGSEPATLRLNLPHALNAAPGLTPYLYPYNHLHDAPMPVHPIEDVRIAANFTPGLPATTLTLSTTARLDEPVDALSRIDASLSRDGNVTLTAVPLNRPDAAPRLLASGQVASLSMTHATGFELWVVDQELSLWVDGRLAARFAFEVPMDRLLARPPLVYLPRPEPITQQQPNIELHTTGPVTLHQLRTDRDLYYGSVSPGFRMQARGSYVKGVEAAHEPMHIDGHDDQPPLQLEDDQFFVLGDNSPLSLDGRLWDSVNPWIEHRYLSDNQQRHGVVPRELMMGRAFFVYFPAPHRWRPQSTGVIPNFGDLRLIY